MARRSSNDIVHLKLRFPEFLRRRIANAAKDNRRSMNAEIMYRLMRAYAIEDFGEGAAAERFSRGMESFFGAEATEPEEDDNEQAT
jgi:hypothetical protein